MSNLNTSVLTKAGIELQAKVQAGSLLKFTRVAIGDGALEDNQHLNTLTNLINYKTSFDVNNVEVSGDGTSIVKSVISNKNLSEGFFLRELGLFAEDPDKGEILYCVINTGMYAEFLPAKTLNNVKIELDLITVVGNASNVVIEVDDSLVYVTREEFKTLAGEGWNKETVKKNADNIMSLAVELSILKNATINGFTDNIFMIEFGEIEENEEVNGVWEKSNKRLVI